MEYTFEQESKFKFWTLKFKYRLFYFVKNILHKYKYIISIQLNFGPIQVLILKYDKRVQFQFSSQKIPNNEMVKSPISFPVTEWSKAHIYRSQPLYPPMF